MRSLLLITAMLISMAGSAQHLLNKGFSAHYGTIRNKQAAKTVVPVYRIQAYAYANNGKLQDTCHYYYSGGRGSAFADCSDNWDLVGTAVNVGDDPTIKADSFFDIRPDNYPLPSVWRRMAFTYGANNAVAGITAMNASYTGGYYKKDGMFAGDLLTEVDNADTNGTGNKSFSLKSKTYKLYDGSGRLVCDSIYDVVQAMPYSKVISYYSTYLDSQVTYYYSSGAWLRYKAKFLTYDASGNISTWTLERVDYYTGLWKTEMKSFYTYNTYNALTRAIGWEYYNYSNQTYTDYPQTINKDTIAYAGNNPNYIYRGYFSIDSASNSWKGVGDLDEQHFHLNNAGKWDTLYSARWDRDANAFMPYQRRTFYYNAGGLIDSTVGQRYDTVTHSYADTTFDKEIFYYDRTDDTPAYTLSLVEIYPNPSAGVFNINWKNPPNGPIKMKLVNMPGQTVMNADWDPSITQVDCTMLAPGMYLFMFYNDGKKPLYVHKVVKY